MKFADSARSKLDGFMRRFSSLPNNFRECLLQIKPKFVLKDKSDFPVIEVSDDELDATVAAAAASATRTPKRRLPPVNAATPTPKRARVEGVPVNGSPVKPEEANGTLRAVPPKRVLLPEPFTSFSDVGRGFRTLSQVRQEIEEKEKAGMPGRTSDEVYEDLAMEAVRPWKGPMEAFLKYAMRVLLSELEDTLNKSLENLKKRLVYKKARELLRDCLLEHQTETAKDLAVEYHLETVGLLTFNKEAFKQYQDAELMELSRYRHYMRLKARGMDTGNYVSGDQLTEDKRLQEAKKREADMGKIGQDPFAREIEVVAYCRGYYRLAALRFSDHVASRLLHLTIPAIRRQLPYYLEDKLGLRSGEPDVFIKLMEEDEATARRRETLKMEKEKFDRALASIEALEMGYVESISMGYEEQQAPTNGFSHHEGGEEDGQM